MTSGEHPWHALLAPLPADAQPKRKPVGTPEVLAAPHGAAIAGWENVVLDLSAGPAGLRIVMAVLDGEGRIVAGSDHVLYRDLDRALPGDGGVWMRQESVGGRFEEDGSFRGTRWLTEGPEPEGDEAPRWTSTPSEPSAGDAAVLAELVRDLVRRAPAKP